MSEGMTAHADGNSLETVFGRRCVPQWCRELRVTDLGHGQLGPSYRISTGTYRGINTRSISHLGPCTLLVVRGLHGG